MQIRSLHLGASPAAALKASQSPLSFIQRLFWNVLSTSIPCVSQIRSRTPSLLQSSCKPQEPSVCTLGFGEFFGANRDKRICSHIFIEKHCTADQNVLLSFARSVRQLRSTYIRKRLNAEDKMAAKLNFRVSSSFSAVARARPVAHRLCNRIQIYVQKPRALRLQGS